MSKPNHTAAAECSPGFNASADTGAVFIINPHIGPTALIDAISQRLTQARGVVAALIGDGNFSTMRESVLADALWTVETLIEEARALYRHQYQARGKGHD